MIFLALVITNDHPPTPEMIELANKYKIPNFWIRLFHKKIDFFITDFLDDQFAPRLLCSWFSC